MPMPCKKSDTATSQDPTTLVTKFTNRAPSACHIIAAINQITARTVNVVKRPCALNALTCREITIRSRIVFPKAAKVSASPPPISQLTINEVERS